MSGTYKNCEKVYIYGAGIVARAAILALKDDAKYKICGCVVSDSSVNLSEVEGFRVFQLDEVLFELKNSKVLLAVRNKFVDDIKTTLSKNGITKIEKIDFEECIRVLERKWLDESGRRGQEFYKHINRDELSDEEYVLFLSKQLKNDVLSFEVNFADHCNLNCQCCNHFSPLAEERYLNKVQYKKDLQKLYELFGEKIGRLMLLGGEPLLNPEIEELLVLTRKCLPKTTLYLVTNGLLFPKMTDEFWDICKNNSISIKVTEYPLNFDYKKWFEYGKEKGVDIVDADEMQVEKTTYRLPLKEEGGLDAFKNYAKCYHANQCIVLREGRLYTCPICALVDILNKYHDMSFPQVEQNSIDIYKANDADVIMNFLKHPIKMCEFCDIYNYEYDIPWKVSKKDRHEWVD